MGKIKKQKGVTLVGVLVGITILSIALAAQIRLLGNTIRRDADLRSLIIGTNLAREGIEILFGWRVTEGWERLMVMKNAGNTYCVDIRNNNASDSQGNCLGRNLKIIGYSDGIENWPNFKAYLYDSKANEYDIPKFWRAMRIKDCDPVEESKCLVLVSTVGWESCDYSKWQACVNSTTGQCDCKLVKLEKKIYNWYVP